MLRSATRQRSEPPTDTTARGSAPRRAHPAHHTALRHGVVAALVVATACGSADSTPAGPATADSTPAGPATAAAVDLAACAAATVSDDTFLVWLEPGSPAGDLALASDAVAGVVGRDRTFVVDGDAARDELNTMLGAAGADPLAADDLPPSVRVFRTDPAEVEALTAVTAALPSVREVSGGDPPPGCDGDDPAVRAAVRRSIEARYEGADLIVFLDPAVSASDEATVRERLLADERAAAVRYLDTDGALEEFRCLFADRPEMIDTVGAADLPVSFRVDVGDRDGVDDRARGLRDTVESLPGVRDVVVPGDLDETPEGFAVTPDCRVEAELIG